MNYQWALVGYSEIILMIVASEECVKIAAFSNGRKTLVLGQFFYLLDYISF